jgi:hypothetical protein
MAPPRATRGGVAAADAAREKERAEEEQRERARAALVVGEVDVNLDSHLLVDKDNRINARAKHHAQFCHELVVRLCLFLLRRRDGKKTRCRRAAPALSPCLDSKTSPT